MIFYDSTGRAVAYLVNDEAIYLFTGEPVAYLYKDLVYSYSGDHLGRFDHGWIRDLDGKAVFFTEDVHGGGPARPARHAIPAKSAKYARPARSARSAPSAKAAISLSWSELSGEQFFLQ